MVSLDVLKILITGSSPFDDKKRLPQEAPEDSNGRTQDACKEEAKYLKKFFNYGFGNRNSH
jgi:hypothetical protein